MLTENSKLTSASNSKYLHENKSLKVKSMNCLQFSINSKLKKQKININQILKT